MSSLKINPLIFGEKILYDNNQGTNETITLNDNIQNYKYLEIFYKENSNNSLNSIKVIPKNNSYINLLSIYPYSQSTQSTYFYETRLKLENNQIIFSGNCNRYVVKADGSVSFLETNDNYIIRVIGYK